MRVWFFVLGTLIHGCLCKKLPSAYLKRNSYIVIMPILLIMKFKDEEGFVSRIRQTGDSLAVTIPHKVIKDKKLKRGVKLLIFIKEVQYVPVNSLIKKVDEDEEDG